MTEKPIGRIKGPGIFLAQFARPTPPFDTLPSIARWAADIGYKGIQVPVSPQFIDIETAATSQSYCDDLNGVCADAGVQITELSTHLQGQLVAVHPAYAGQFDAFAPADLKGKPHAQSEWATRQVKLAAQASARLGLSVQVGFSGALAWPYLYPWPQRPEGLVAEAFGELARRWRPILDLHADLGQSYAYELHPGEDLMDGTSFERFLSLVDDHPAVAINYDPSHFVLQQLDYLGFIDVYGDRIKAFHVKDAEFTPSARQGVYSGFADWRDRAGRFRSLGDGQVDFRGIFSRLADAGYDGWAVLEWECCLKSPERGALEGAPFIHAHLIDPTSVTFDDFASSGSDVGAIRSMLGLEVRDA